MKKSINLIFFLIIALVLSSVPFANGTEVKADYYTEYNEYEKVADEIIGRISPEWSDVEIALYLHDEIVTRCKYGQNETGSSFYDVIVLGKSLCSGYAATYKDLMERAGVECEIIWSKSVNHEWNLVKIDGKYYHVDTTWDDTCYDEGNDIEALCLHTFFLLSDEAMIEKINFNQNHGDGSDWQTDAEDYYFGKADSDKYQNRFWTLTSSKCAYREGRWYSVHSDIIVSTSFTKEEDFSKTEYQEKCNWYKRETVGEWDDSIFLADGNGEIYFNSTSCIYKITDAGIIPVYRIDEKMYEKGYIYGITSEEKEKVKIEIRKSPYSPPSFYVICLDNDENKDNVCSSEQEHNYTTVKVRSGNCISEGYILKRCTKCQKEAVFLTGIGNHCYDWKGAVKATYFSNGYTGKMVCCHCNSVISDGKIIGKKVLKTPKIKVKINKKSATISYSKPDDATGLQIKYKKKKGKWSVIKIKRKKRGKLKIKLKGKASSYKIAVRSYRKENKKICYSNWVKK
ncbi:MAG: hypothetical protein E7254_07010 [Lachnospiraceae bacterium]|nr:hypothetical protein [Lachnospiraceae bacterium]